MSQLTNTFLIGVLNDDGTVRAFGTAKSIAMAIKKRQTLAGPYGESTVLRLYRATADGKYVDVTPGTEDQ